MDHKIIELCQIYSIKINDEPGATIILEDGTERKCNPEDVNLIFGIKDYWDVNKQPEFEMPDEVKKDWLDFGFHPGMCTCCWCDIKQCNFRWDIYNTRGDCLLEK